MKKMIRTLTGLLFALLILLESAPVAYAAGSSIVVSGKSLFEYDTVSQYTQTDLFDNFKNVLPGDKLTEEITISNQILGADYIQVYLKAIPHDETKNPLSYSEAFEEEDGHDQAGIDGQRDETVKSMSEFLSQLTMRVYNGKKLIFEGSPDAARGLKKNVYLGKIRRLRSMDLKVELEVPVTLGNEYANRVGEVDWQFTIEAHDDPDDNPTTGDYIMAAVAVMILSGIGLVILLLIRKKKKEDS